MKKQWFEFMDWYAINQDKDLVSDNIPSNVSNWPSSSWLKYHIKFCVEKNKYFVYPYHSLSTNFTDVGQHNDTPSTTYQVPIVTGKNFIFNMPKILDSDSLVKYDVFYERVGLGTVLCLNDKDLAVNLYGKKNPHLVRYVLTTQILPFKIIKSYGLLMRPHEANVIYDIKGTSIFLYDSHISSNNPTFVDQEVSNWVYDVKHIHYTIIAKILMLKLLIKLQPREIAASLMFRLRKNKIK